MTDDTVKKNKRPQGRPFHKAKPKAVRNERPAPLPEKPGLAVRKAAAKVLSAVVDRKTSLDGMFDSKGGNPAILGLDEADRGLARALVTTALRHRRRLAGLFDSLLKTPLPEGARSLEHILMIGAVQILYLDVPDHAAVDLAVEHALADPRTRRFANLVNALLRRIGRERDEMLAAMSDAPVLPDWFRARLETQYGAEVATTIEASQLAPSAIDLTVKSDPEQWADKFGGRVLPTGSVRLPADAGSIPKLEGFEEGAWWVQDAAASIPARLFGDVSGLAIVDLCAAPGGKTAQLVAAGAEVTALDQSASRLARLQDNLKRLGMAAQTIQSNMLDFQTDHLFDGALLDAPCSSTGTCRRHPDVPWIKDAADIETLAALQERMLRKALSLVRPGGLVVFSNCSIDKTEGEAVVARVLASDPSVSLRPVDPSLFPGLPEAFTSEGTLRTTPDMVAPVGSSPGGMDGFFAAVLQRNP
ncbi:16S rRNA (cytosine967-C5)-methyltransferase [Rhizobium sp. RU20A]|nr:16S rRNA (cytosine967-C5)-methyltransferase [Rhizobium sp. RU20A]